MASLIPHSGMLGHRLASHLLRRTTYNFTKDRVDYYAQLTPSQAVAELFEFKDLAYEEPHDFETGQTWINSGVTPISVEPRLRYFVSAWWLHEASVDTSIGHKLEFFLHTIFPTSYNIRNESYYDHLMLLRFFALRGSFLGLSLKMIMDNSMLNYLDNRFNVVGGVNENFAREFLELHTIQKGPEDGPGSYTNYTEHDVAEAAKLLTGWKVAFNRDIIDPLTQLPRGRYIFNDHDTSTKQFSDKFQNRIIQGATSGEDMERELRDFVEMILDQRATAENLVRRIYRFFVSNTISVEVENDIVQPLSEQLIESGYYNFHLVIKTLLRSQHFYDLDDSDNTDNIVGTIMKSPMDILLNVMSTFDIYPPEPTTPENMEYHYLYCYSRHTTNSLIAGGLSFHNPPSVAGYPPYHQEPSYSQLWFNTATIIGRFRFPEMFLKNKFMDEGGNLRGNTHTDFDITLFVHHSGFVSNPSNGEILVDEFIKYLLPETISEERTNYFLEIFLDNLSLTNWQVEWQNYIDTGDSSSVSIALSRLFTALLYSEEYQLQ